MVKAEKAFKWGVAIVVIFGIINALYFLNLIIGLKIVLPILCVFLIGSILLQSGKGVVWHQLVDWVTNRPLEPKQAPF